MRKHTTRVCRRITYILGILCLISVLIDTAAEAKKRRGGASSALKVLRVTSIPTPFEVGRGELTFSVLVKVPKNVRGMDVLEVTALITSSTQRSMRFLSRRVTLHSEGQNSKASQIPLTLVWDGKDQTKKLVEPGVYRYEMRAKLMVEKSTSMRTKMVSRRSRGMVEVTTFDVPEPAASVEPTQNSPASSPDSQAVEEKKDGVQETSEQLIVDEVEMLPDESTGHPVPGPDQEETETSEGSESIGSHQEG